ncbi:MAG: D-2-hydroxyacid dehydrogenase, partial [Planctomycetes bacterium]|nr:D-2-hydroxyacid dehydrogenase [Planctomycetota bacterium]
LVIHPPVEPHRLAKIIEAAGSMEVVNAATPDDALGAIADADAFFGKLTPPLLAASRKLRWVQSPTASLEHYMFSELVSHPCQLTNMRGLYSDVIADHVFGYILCFARNLHIYIRQQIQRHWAPMGGEESRTTFERGPGTVSSIDLAHRQLAGATLGIVGLGHIGRAIAQHGVALGIRVVAVDPRPAGSPEGVEAVWPTSDLPRLLGQSDYVVIAAPHTPATEGWFRREQFRQMRPSAYLINIGRGAIVKLDDLCAALTAREIAGAGLDVFETEQLPANHPLWGFENVILTPHVAGTAPVVAERHLDVLLDNVRRFASGQPLRNVVNKAEWF